VVQIRRRRFRLNPFLGYNAVSIGGKAVLMHIVNRYILKRILGPCVLAVAAVAVLGVANEIQERIARLPVAQMTIGDVARLMVFSLPSLAAYLVPITYLLGILLAFSSLAQNNEIVAMKAAGIPLKRIVVPILVLGSLLSVLCFLLQDRVHPWATTKIRDLIATELPLRVALDTLPTGVTQEFAGWRVSIGSKDPVTGELFDVVILKQEGERASTYYAGSARLLKENGQSTLEMKNVHFIPAGESDRVTPLTSDMLRLPVPTVSTHRSPPSRREMSLAQLYGENTQMTAYFEETHLNEVGKNLRKLRREIAERICLPFACLAVALMAAPIGARAKRSGRSYTFAVGFCIATVYYVFHLWTEIKSVQPLPLVIGVACLPNLVFIAVGLGLVWRVDRV